MSFSLPRVQDGVTTVQVGKELLVYCGSDKTAHCLSSVGITVFQACEKSESLESLVEALRISGVEEPETVVEESLAQLVEKNILSTETTVKFSKRRFLQAAGAAVALPIIASVIAPRPSAAASCVGTCGVFPGSCANCGRLCDAALVCAVLTQLCCFEYTLDTTQGAMGTGCKPNLTGTANGEQSGVFTCRNTAPRIFMTDCAAARDATLGAGFGTGQLYYCCTCPTAVLGTCL